MLDIICHSFKAIFIYFFIMDNFCIRQSLLKSLKGIKADGCKENVQSPQKCWDVKDDVW